MPAVLPAPELLDELEARIRAHHALIFFETVEEDRIRTVLEYLSDRVGMHLFVWSPATGLAMQAPDGGRPVGTEKPEQCLAFIEQANLEAIFFLPGFPQLDTPLLKARLKEIHRRYSRHRGQVVFCDAVFSFPPEVEPLLSPVEIPAASTEAYHRFVAGVLQDIAKRRAIQVDLSSNEIGELLNALHGLTFFDVEKIISRAVITDGRLDRSDLTTILDAKRRVIDRSGLLEYFPHQEKMNDVAGLRNLKAWLRKRRRAFSDSSAAKAFGLDPPKGLLLLGVQGCGKSLTAKAVAAEWGLPLLRLDPGNLYQKYFGESERNLQKAIRLAEDIAPCVLWVDEIEKGLSQGQNEGGTSQRVLGGFLSWLQEKKESVFVIATANDITGLPPELLRKGRFDEIFFVDLPDEPTRKAVMEVHLQRRGRNPSTFDTTLLARETEGFSGAEIEQAVVSALYTAFETDGVLTTEDVLTEVLATRPLSTTMKEQIDELRDWAKERTVRAD